MTCRLLVMQSQIKIGLSLYLQACANRSESNPIVPEMEIVFKILMHEERKLKDQQVLSESGSVEALTVRHKTGLKGPKCYAV